MTPARQGRTDTRSAILDAALAAFDGAGYGEVTMSEIRRAAGASTGSLYHHFPSRSHIIAAIWLDSLRSFQSGFADEIARARTAQTGVRRTVTFHAQWLSDHPDRARCLLTHHDPSVVAVAADETRRLNRTFYDQVLTWYDRHAQAGRVRPLPLEALAAIWIGPTQELGRSWLNGQATSPPIQFADVLARATWQALAS